MNLQEQINRIHSMMFEQENDSKINETDKVKKILFKLIDKEVEGADIYEHEGSLWIIFTDEEKWVIALQEHGALWYNPDIFHDIFKFFNTSSLERRKLLLNYMTEWFKDNIKNEVKYDAHPREFNDDNIKNVLTYGTKIGKIKND
jgi:hypothetical protein